MNAIWASLYVFLIIVPSKVSPIPRHDDDDHHDDHDGLNKQLNFEALKIKIDKSVADELRNNKYYARGRTNIGCKEDVSECTPQMRWGPAKDASYFLYDYEPFVEEEFDLAKRRTKRKDEKVKVEEEDYEVADETCAESDVEDAENDVNNGDDDDDINSCIKNKLAENTWAGNRGKHRHEKYVTRRHIWETWGPWGPCSTTCGPGTKSRWRHCFSPTCPKGEKEAQIQSCINIQC